MEKERPYRAIRRAWVAHLAATKGGPAQVASDIGSVDTHVTAMAKGRRNVGDQLAGKIEEAYNLGIGTIDHVEPPPIPGIDNALTLTPTEHAALELTERSSTYRACPTMPTLAKAAEAIAMAINKADPNIRDPAAGLLANLAKSPETHAKVAAALAAILGDGKSPPGEQSGGDGLRQRA